MGVSVSLIPFWLQLKDLSQADKLSLIELLVKSLQSDRQNQIDLPQNVSENEDWVHRFAGSWSDFPETAEEIIALIEQARTPGRQVEQL